MRYIGKDGVVHVGGSAVAQVVGYEYTKDSAVAEARVCAQGYVGHSVGDPAVTGTINCLDDPSDTAGQGALLGDGPVALTFYPQGVGSGKPEETIAAAYINSIPFTLDPAEHATRAFSFVADAALVVGTQT